MKFRKLLLAFAAIGMMITATPKVSTAQWSLGASYEIRQEAPKNGFGVRIERGILEKLPVVDLGIRAHFSYFNEDNYADENNLTYSGEITDYDFGLAAIGGISVGLVKPYVGLGLGSQTTELSKQDAPSGTDTSDSKLFWNGLVGSEITIIPKLHPFIEYRFQPTDAPQNFKDANINSSDGRLIFGLSLSF